jgi:hypothetical protein
MQPIIQKTRLIFSISGVIIFSMACATDYETRLANEPAQQNPFKQFYRNEVPAGEDPKRRTIEFYGEPTALTPNVIQGRW